MTTRPPTTGDATGVGLAPLLTLTVILTAMLVGATAWSGGFGAHVGSADLYSIFLPRFRWVADAYREGRFPLWNPIEACGLPLHGSSYGMALYAPVVLANLVLPSLTALRVLYAAHIAGLVLFTLLYLRRTNVHLAGGVVAAAIASSSIFNGAAKAGVDQPHFLFSVMWLPAILLAWEAMLGGRWQAAALVAVCLAMQWLPGYPEFSLATALLLALIATVGYGATLPRRVVLAGILVGLGALIAAANILPVAEMVAESNRTPGVDRYREMRFFFAVQSAYQLTDLSLRRYGAAGVFCLLLGMMTHAPYRRVWAAAFLLALFVLNPPLVYLYEVWPFSGLRYAWGWNALFPFFAGCLAALGIHRLRQPEATPSAWLAPALGVVVVGLALVTRHPVEAAVAAACALAVWPALRRAGGWMVPLVLVLAHAALVMATIGEGLHRAPAQPLAARIPVLKTLQQALSTRVVAGPELRAGLLLPERLRSAVGYEPSNPPRRTDRLTGHLRLQFIPVGREGIRGTWEAVAANPGVASLLGIGLVTPHPLDAPKLEANGYGRIARLPDGDPVLYRPAAPRFQVLRRIVRATDEDDSFRLVTAADFDPTRSVVLEEEPALAISPEDAEKTGDVVRLEAETPERIELRVSLARPGMLVVTDTYFPGWKAHVNGAPTDILRANHAFRSIALQAGTHVVEMVYDPASFRRGVALSFAGLAVTVGLWLFARAGHPPR